MKRMSQCLVIGVIAAFCSVAVSQEVPEASKPAQEHEFLKRFVGEWKSRVDGNDGTDQPVMVAEGIMKSRMLGDLWVVSDVTIEGTGFRMAAVQTIGYDTEKKKYIGTWVDSMYNHMWQYEGWIDESGRKLILEATGPNPSAAGEIAKFRDTYEFTSDDHIIAGSLVQTDDGEWAVMMTGEMHRKK